MEVYKSGPGSFPVFAFVYDIVASKFKVLRVKSGPMAKFGFHEYNANQFRNFHQPDNQYKGDFPEEVKKKTIEAIFWYKKWH